MAINPESRYPGKINPASTDYPYGAARNITLPGDGTGTPWEAAIVNDLFGFQQALLARAGVTPSGDPDTAVTSQYLTALSALVMSRIRTYADLQAVDTSEITAVNLDELWPGNQTSGGTFIYDPTADKASANGGVIIDTDKTLENQGGSAGTGCWVRKYDGAVNVKWFGANGDGITDDTYAIQSAIDYCSVNDIELNIPSGTFLSGRLNVVNDITISGNTQKDTIIKRVDSSPDISLIYVTATVLECKGITFDGSRDTNANPCHTVLITNSLTSAVFSECKFTGGKTSGGYGSGLYISSSSLATQISIKDCVFINNDEHGLSSPELYGFSINECVFTLNGGAGLYMNNYDTTFTQKITGGDISNCECSNNGSSGISIGNFIENNDLNSPTYGGGNYEASHISISNCRIQWNSGYGIVAEGRNMTITGNIISNNGGTATGLGGVLCNMGFSVINGNSIVSNSFYGIDAGGAQELVISDNLVNYNGQSSGVSGTGIAIGGSVNCIVSGNNIKDNGVDDSGTAISVQRYEGTGTGYSFQNPATNLLITNNAIRIGAARIGVSVKDGVSGVGIKSNTFSIDNYSSNDNISRCIKAIVKKAEISGNTLLGIDGTFVTPVDDSGVISKPNVLDFIYTNSDVDITSLSPSDMVDIADGIAWVDITDGGSGYDNTTTATISGDGTGAEVQVGVNNGSVVSVKVLSFGSGYTTAEISFSGTGSGATAEVQIGMPLPSGYDVELQVNQAETLLIGGSPNVKNTTGTDVSLPINGSCRLKSRYGRWDVLNIEA